VAAGTLYRVRETTAYGKRATWTNEC